MTDDLERLVRSTQGEGPSPEFVTSLRERIVTETSTPSISADDHPVVDIDLRSNRRDAAMANRWKLVALVAAVVALILGFLALDDDRGLETVGRDDESPPTTSTIDEEPTGTNEGPPVSFVADAAPMDVEGVDLEPGTYRVDAVGTPFSLTLDQPMTPELNRAGMLELTHPNWAGPDDRDIRFVRLTALSDPTDPTKQLEDQQDGWPADDFAGWQENLTDGIQITNEEATTVGGLPAMRADLEVVDITCPSGVPITLCTTFGVNDRGGYSTKALLPGSKYRIWVVDQDNEAPFAIIAGTRDADDPVWLDEAERVVSTMAFGDIAPNPVLVTSAGPIDLAFLDGVRVEMPGDGLVIPGPVPAVGTISIDDVRGWISFMANPLDRSSGSPVDATDLVERITVNSSEVTEVGSASVGGLSAQVFDISGGRGDISVKWHPDSNPTQGLGWFLPPRARLWLVDHPDRGLLMIAAETWDEADETAPPIIGVTEEMLASLEFIELG